MFEGGLFESGYGLDACPGGCLEDVALGLEPGAGLADRADSAVVGGYAGLPYRHGHQCFGERLGDELFEIFRFHICFFTYYLVTLSAKLIINMFLTSY